MGFSGGWEAIGPRDTQGDEEVPLRIVGSRDKISESVDPSRITQPAMEREGIDSLPLYPEGRACRRPTARKVIDLFEDVQRHELSAGRRPAVVFTTKLSRLQRRILRLLNMRGTYDI